MSGTIGPATFLERIVRAQGSFYAPKGMLLTDPVTEKDWMRAVRKEILPQARNVFAHTKSLRATARISHNLTLRFAVKNNELLWYLRADSLDVGAGRLLYFKSDDTFAVDYAAIFPKGLRGHRLYSKILRTMASTIDAPMESSSNFKSVAALRAWKRMGLYMPEHGRFRLQPEDNYPRLVEFQPAFRAEDFGSFLTGLAT